MIDPVRLAAIQQRVEKVSERGWCLATNDEEVAEAWWTKGPAIDPSCIVLESNGEPVCATNDDGIATVPDINNAAFIAHAKQDIPYLLSAVTALQEAIRAWFTADAMVPGQLGAAVEKLRSLVPDPDAKT